MRLGLLSTAAINTALIAGVRASAGAAEVVAVGSRDAERSAAYAREHGLARAHGSYEALLADPEVDAVYVSLPNAMHVEWSVKALQAGKHVLCEKPLGRDPGAVAGAFDVADAEGLTLMEAFMWRHTPQAALLEKLLPRVGALRLVRASFSFGQRSAGDVRLSAALEGGALMDVGCYCVSAARLIAGEPESFAARAVLGGDGVDVACAGAMTFDAGVLASFDCGMTMAPRDELEVVGVDGSLVLDDPWHAREPVIELRTPDGVQALPAAAADPSAAELAELAAAVAGERPARFGRADAIGQARALGALHAAAQASPSHHEGVTGS